MLSSVVKGSTGRKCPVKGWRLLWGSVQRKSAGWSVRLATWDDTDGPSMPVLVGVDQS